MSLLRMVDKFNYTDDLIIAACCTPFHQNREIDFSRFEAYADQMANAGISGLFVNGTLGEGMSLTTEERKQTLERWMELKPNRFRSILVHVGAVAISDTIELVRHAESVGVDGIAVMCPILFKPTSISNLVAYLKEVAAAAPNTPFMYYDINVLTGVVFETGEIMRQCKKHIPNFVGIKYSCRELGNYESAMMETEEGKYKLALGTVDEVFLPWLTIGARVPICHSFMAPFHAKTRGYYLSGDMTKAAESQRVSQKLGLLKRKYGSDIAVSKAMLRLTGIIDVGPVRLPLEELSEEKCQSLKGELAAMNLL